MQGHGKALWVLKGFHDRGQVSCVTAAAGVHSQAGNFRRTGAPLQQPAQPANLGGRGAAAAAAVHAGNTINVQALCRGQPMVQHRQGHRQLRRTKASSKQWRCVHLLRRSSSQACCRGATCGVQGAGCACSHQRGAARGPSPGRRACNKGRAGATAGDASGAPRAAACGPRGALAAARVDQVNAANDASRGTSAQGPGIRDGHECRLVAACLVLLCGVLPHDSGKDGDGGMPQDVPPGSMVRL